VSCQGCGASWRLSALLDPLLQEISKPGEANGDTTVDEEELVTSKGSPQPASSLRPALRLFSAETLGLAILGWREPPHPC